MIASRLASKDDIAHFSTDAYEGVNTFVDVTRHGSGDARRKLTSGPRTRGHLSSREHETHGITGGNPIGSTTFAKPELHALRGEGVAITAQDNRPLRPCLASHGGGQA